MPNITCDPNWKGVSNNLHWSNHESNMTEADPINPAKLIVDIPGMPGAAVPDIDPDFLASASPWPAPTMCS